MPTAPPQKNKVARSKIDLRKLRQHEVAYIIGRSPRWIRERSHLFARDADGRYDARQVVEAMLKLAAPPRLLY